jgi:hypothetical protein
VDPSGPDTIARRPQCRTHTADTAAVPAGGGSTPGGGHPGLDSRPRRGSAAAVDTACGGLGPLPSPAGVQGRSAADDRQAPRCSGACGRVRGGWRPSGRYLAAIPDVRRTLPRCPVPWTPLGCGQVGAAGRHRRSKPTTADVARGHRQPAGGRPLWTPATAAGHADAAAAAGWTACSATVHCRLHVRPGTDRKLRHRPAPPWPDRQIRRLVLYVHAMRLSAVGAAQLRCPIQPVIPGAVWCWLVDCHADCHASSRYASEVQNRCQLGGEHGGRGR